MKAQTTDEGPLGTFLINGVPHCNWCAQPVNAAKINADLLAACELYLQLVKMPSVHSTVYSAIEKAVKKAKGET